MKNLSIHLTTAALLVVASLVPAEAAIQNDQQSRQQERIDNILGTIFGDRGGSSSSIEAQWAAGRTPLANQQTQFNTRVDNDVQTASLEQRTATRLKSDYAELVQLELRYGADRRFTTQERTELADRYRALTQVLANQAYDDDGIDQTPTVAEGKLAFIARVDASIVARRISRVAGNRLKADYTMLVQTENSYLRDGVIDQRERDDLDARLDVLDERVGDTAYSGSANMLTPRARLDAIAKAIPLSNLAATAQAQLRVEHSDLSYLGAAYTKLTVTMDERKYLEGRLSDLERRLQIRAR